MAASGRAAEAERLAQAGRYDDGAALLIRAADEGDPDALLALALWRVGGEIVRRDLNAARRLLRDAAAAGQREAMLLHASFLASGTGGPPDWSGAVAALEEAAAWSEAARGQLALLEHMDVGEDGYPRAHPQAEALSEAPRASAARGFLSAAECAWLRQRAEPWLQPSVVVDPTTGRMVPHPIRTSDGAYFGVTQEDVVVSAINRRIAALSRTTIAQGEPLQVLRYRPGAEYKAHFDALPPGGNQRIATVLVYLSDRYEGGETVFPRTSLSFRGRTGDALLFWNVLPGGAPDPMSLHAGLPVRSGEKSIATRWIREGPFTYPPPEPETGSRFD